MILRWPVHPQPNRHETLSSWLLRSARANASSLSSWLAAVEGSYDDATSVDTTRDPPLWEKLAEGAALSGGPDALRSLTFVGIERRLSSQGVARWMLSVDDRVGRAKHGFCAICLAADHTPYLRKAWRLEWHRWCPEHGCRLRWQCRCGAMFAPWKRSWDRPFTSCWSCGRDVVRGRPRGDAVYAKAPRFVMEAIQQATALALDESARTEASPFPAVWCLQKWAEAVGRETWPSWVERLELGSAKDASPPTAADEVAWSFALAWHLAVGPYERLATLVLRHQSTFNRATSVHCPDSLLLLQRRVHVRRDITEAEVEEVVTSLVENDMPVTYLAVSEALKVSSNRISANSALRGVVDRSAPVVLQRWCATIRVKLMEARERIAARGARLSRANLATEASVSLEAITRFERETGETYAVSPSESYEKLVTSAITALRSRGERITASAVARYLGRERSFIEKRKDLQEIVRTARDARPTSDEVRRACAALSERMEPISILGVARMLKRGREVIERSEPLRAVVSEAQREERQRMEARIRDAVEELAERGGPTTVAAVCRELGFHRSYVEKRGRLREIVMRARR